MPTPPASDPHHEEFSLPLFVFTIVVSLGVLGGLLAWLAPGVWQAQLVAPAWKVAVAFVSVSLVLCFFEYFFHRYVLHTPAVPLLRYLYRQHTLHHALTRIVRRPVPGGRGILCVENKFAIEEEEQHEAAFFPWYAMVAFSVVMTPLLVLLHAVLPGFPWFLAGLAAIACSLTLYEVLHAINHWPLQRWLPLITHRRWGWFWQPIYGFHLRHHAVIDCNESISGFFGLPVADWVFGTCVVPRTLYADGEAWSEEAFRSPRPHGLIRKLDAWAAAVVARRRGHDQSGEAGR